MTSSSLIPTKGRTHSVPPPQFEPESSYAPVAFYRGMCRLPRSGMIYELAESLQEELQLDGDAQRRAVIARLRAWLQLTFDQAASIAAAWHQASEALIRPEQRRLEAVERDAVLNGLTFAEFRRLAEFVPWLRAWRIEPPQRSDGGLTLSVLAAAIGLSTPALV